MARYVVCTYKRSGKVHEEDAPIAFQNSETEAEQVLDRKEAAHKKAGWNVERDGDTMHAWKITKMPDHEMGDPVHRRRRKDRYFKIVEN